VSTEQKPSIPGKYTVYLIMKNGSRIFYGIVDKVPKKIDLPDYVKEIESEYTKL
jgi:hypothetical protein